MDNQATSKDLSESPRASGPEAMVGTLRGLAGLAIPAFAELLNEAADVIAASPACAACAECERRLEWLEALGMWRQRAEQAEAQCAALRAALTKPHVVTERPAAGVLIVTADWHAAVMALAVLQAQSGAGSTD